MYNIKARAPGSLMILGEHAVLKGSKCVVASINKIIEVELTPNDYDYLIINSNIGNLKLEISNINKYQNQSQNFEFLLACIQSFDITTGFTLNIKSEIKTNEGLGSSAAVTAATLAVLYKWIFKKNYSRNELFLHTKKIIQKVQGNGSGADCAASVYGGIVEYSIKIGKIKTLPNNINICSIYSGEKKTTKEVLRFVEQEQKKFPEKYKKFFNKIAFLANKGIEYIKNNQQILLGTTFNKHHQAMQEIGLTNHSLDEIHNILINTESVLGAKVSGSGMGDSVIALYTSSVPKFIQNNIKISTQGTIYVE